VVGEVSLTVTRDFGARRLLQRDGIEARESDTVMRVLDRNAEIATRYGGRFVQAIDGISGTRTGGRLRDWFFYVNGVESPRGAADFALHAEDRIWWDYRDWNAAMRVPAVVGAWPEPFVHGFDGRRWPAAVVCQTARPVCGEVRSRLRRVGAELGRRGESLDVLVGPWARLRDRESAAVLDGGPAESGVFARFVRAAEGWRLILLDGRGGLARALAGSAGLVAATREGEDPPSWLVTGTDAAGVQDAVELLDARDLRDRFAVATLDGTETPVPVP
jgi:hypothetical protein